MAVTKLMTCAFDEPVMACRKWPVMGKSQLKYVEIRLVPC
jgi:hypothetical protein